MDTQAFVRLFEANRPDFVSYAARRIGDNLAEDAVQDTYLTALQLLPKYRHQHGTKGFCGWIHEILWRKCSESVRRERRHNHLELLDEPPLDTVGVDIAEVATNRAQIRAIIDQTDTLTDTQRLVLLARLDSHADWETAQRLGIRENAVRAHVSVALAKVREAI